MKFGYPLVLLAGVGCATSSHQEGVHFTRYSVAAPHPLTAKPVESVRVLTRKPTEPGVVVGVIEARHASSERGLEATKEMPDMNAELRQKAAEVGCDAIYVHETDTRVGAARGPVKSVFALAADCFVFTTPAQPQGSQ